MQTQHHKNGTVQYWLKAGKKKEKNMPKLKYKKAKKRKLKKPKKRAKYAR